MVELPVEEERLEVGSGALEGVVWLGQQKVEVLESARYRISSSTLGLISRLGVWRLDTNIKMPIVRLEDQIPPYRPLHPWYFPLRKFEGHYLF